MKKKNWVANWIEPMQENAIEEAPLTLEEAVRPNVTFGDGSLDLKPCKEIKFEFDVNEADLKDKAFIYASAHGVYELRLNGRKLGDALLAPETTNYNKLIWYQEYEITGFLKPGRNDLRIYLADGWWIGRIGLNGESCQYGNRLGFIGQIEIGNKILPVDETALSRNFYIKYSDLYIGEKWDLTEEESDWEPCLKADYPRDLLELQPIPSMKYTAELPVKEFIITPDGDLVLDFGQVCAGVVELEVNINKRATITVEHAEVLSKEGNFKNNIVGRFKDQKDVFVLDEKHNGAHLRPLFTFHGFRYARISGISKENIVSAKAKVIGTPLEKTGFFESDNELLNKLQHAIEWSELSNMMSVPTDCPQRERMGWTGDILAFAPTGGFLFDLKNFLETWLYQLRLDQLDNGEVPVVIPNHPAQDKMQKIVSGTSSCAAWSDVCVLLPYDLYELYGDTSAMKDNFETMEKWLTYIENVDWGHLMHFGDWLIPSLREDPEGPMKGAMATCELVAWCYYCITLEHMIKICNILEKDSAHYTEKLADTRKRILRDYVKPDGSVCSGTLQGQYVIAIESGALDSEAGLKAKVMKRLADLIEKNNNCLDTGFASVPYLLDVLYDNGYKDLAYKVLFNTRQPGWLYMATKGATTIWENWNAIHEDGTVTDYSYNHYAYGCVGKWIYEHVGGLKSLAPGFKKIKAAPDRDMLKAYGVTRCKTQYKSPYGLISVEWDESGVRVEAPEGVEVLRSSVFRNNMKENSLNRKQDGIHMDLETIFGSYFAWMAKPGTWFISFMNGSQFLYLLEGDDRALLIDTGYAIGNLRPFVEKLTDRPIEVINTHFHPDHAGGNGEWERVYVSKDWKKDEKSILKTMGDVAALPFPDYEKLCVGTGDVIDLGGRKIEIYKAEDCHSYSSLYLLDRKERLLFMGDEIDSWQVLLYDNSNDPGRAKDFSTDTALKNYRKNLEFVKIISSDYDWILGNHNGAPLDASYLDDFIGLVDGVYSGETVICESLDHPYISMDPVAGRLARIRYKKASAFVFKDQLLQIYGNQRTEK